MVTIFRSRLRPGVEDAYGEVATRMNDLVEQIDGFIDQKFYISPDGERVTVVRFRDFESHQTWAQHPEHRLAQRRGQEEFYSWYDISVSQEMYSRDFENLEP